MSEHTILIKRIALVGIAQFITGTRGLFLLPILAKTLGPASYGIWSQVLITIGFLLPFATLNLSLGMVRFLSAEKVKQNTAKGIFTVIFSTLFVGAFFGAVLFLFSDPFAAVLLRDPSASLFIKIASALLILEALNRTCLEPFRMFGQLKKYSILMVSQTILEIILVSLLLFFGFGLMGALAAFCIVRVIILLFSLFFIVFHTGFSLPDFSLLRPYLAFALPFIPTGLLDTTIALSDRYVIGFFRGASTVGIYSAAYNVASIAGIFVFPICYILTPTIFKLFDQNLTDKVKDYLSYSLKYFLFFSIPSIFGITVMARSVLNSLTTAEFTSLITTFVVMLVSLSAIVFGVQTILGEILMLFKNTKFFIIAFGVGAITNIGLNIILVPLFGIIAAAASTLIAYGLVAIITYWKVSSYMKFNVNFLFIIKSIIASSLMALAIYVFNPLGIKEILLSIIVGAIMYFVMIFSLKGFEKKELEVISQILKLNKIKV